FDNDTCRTALTKIAEEFGLEYIVNDREISLGTRVGTETVLSLQYGRGNGLSELTRQAIEDKNGITRVYGFGGPRNIDYNYRDGRRKLVFDSLYLEDNTLVYGVRETSVTFDDIFPQRTGTVTAVSGTDLFQFTDSNIDFDLNDYLMEGLV